MDILCLMGLFPKEYESVINEKSKKGVQNAANKLQWGIATGLSQQPGVKVSILNSLYIGSFPRRYKDLIVPSFSFSHCEGADDKNVGFVNLTLFKTISRYFGLKKEIKKWMESRKNEDIAVIAYAMTSPFVELLSYIHRINPKVKTCLIVPDLPEYMNAGAQSNIIYKSLKQIQIRHFKGQLRSVDGFVLLTKYMKEWFDWDIRFTVVEGISLKTEKDFKVVGKKEKAILYAGLLEEKYGVLDLVKAFKALGNKEWTLDLFGSGSAIEDIKGIASDYSNIHVHGKVPNTEVLEYQTKSAILINPRNDTNAFTKYSFPSKVIEYMGSGRPMVAYKLAGMPDEYIKHFYVISPSKDGLKETLEKVMSFPEEELNRMGKDAFEFIVREKSTKKQGERIISFLYSL